METISNLIASIFGKKKGIRVLFLGLDASGRTTTLYLLKTNEVHNTIPTIGFNVEEVEIDGVIVQIWDIGGCDKIRPLWRHYFQNSDAVVFFVDATDRFRLINSSDSLDLGTASGLLTATMAENELKDAVLLVLVTKQDVEGAMSPGEVEDLLELSKYRTSGRAVRCVGSSCYRRDALLEDMQWLSETALQVRHTTPAFVEGGGGSRASVVDEEGQRMEALLSEWLHRIDESDDDFLGKLYDCSLESWDHRTHLRIAWLLLGRLGRREGMNKTFESIKHFIETSPRTRGREGRGNSFHETMTYFWVHMVDFSMRSTHNPSHTFQTFLLMNPHLANGGLFLHYYSKRLMLLDAESRTSVLLPDIRPLPSLITDVHAERKPVPSLPLLQPRAPLTDAEFMSAVHTSKLPAWGHYCKLRLIYLLLQENLKVATTRNAVAVLDVLSRIEKGSHHVTVAYFWLQMVTYHVALMNRDAASGVFIFPGRSGAATAAGVDADASISFDVFFRRPHSQPLRNELLIDKYYSRRLIDSADAAESFCLPDLKQLPSTVP